MNLIISASCLFISIATTAEKTRWPELSFSVLKPLNDIPFAASISRRLLISRPWLVRSILMKPSVTLLKGRDFMWSRACAAISSSVDMMARKYIPAPMAMPMATVAQMPAAVVRPIAELWRTKMIPAPRNPIADTTPETTRDGSSEMLPWESTSKNQGRCDSDDHMRPDACALLPAFAFYAEGASAEGRRYEPDDEFSLHAG